jgi:hypothetical protein
MAYGELYRVNFFDPDEHKFLLQIYEDGYSGIVSDNLTLGANPVVISYQQDDDFFNPIIGSSCKLQFYIEESTGGGAWDQENTNWNLADFLWNAEGSIDFLEPQNDRQFQVVISSRRLNGTSDAYAVASRLKDDSIDFTASLKVGDIVINTTTGDTTTVAQVSSATIIKLSADIFDSAGGEGYEIYRKYWTGFIVQDSFNLPLQPYPFLIEAYASDLIGTLEGYDYELTTTRPSAFEAIRECLRQINLENGQGDSGKSLDFSYKFLCRMFQNNADGSSATKGNPFAQSHINDKQAFKNQNGNPLDCKFILNNLLLMYNCRIFQHESTWTIISNDSLSLSTFNQDYSSANPSQFITYDKNGSNESTLSISDPTKNINSSQDADTIQPLNGDLMKSIRRPAIRNRVNVRIKDKQKDVVVNGDFESVSSPSGSIPSDAYDIDTWSITDTANTFAVDVNTATYGITPYQGSYSMLNIGNDTSGGGASNIIATNSSVSISNTFDDIKFNFALFADQPATYDGNLLDYFFYFKIYIVPTTGTTRYWSVIDNQWKTSTTTINNIRGSVANEWIRHSFTLTPAPITGTLYIELYEPEEANFPSGTDFRLYLDEIKIQSTTPLEYYSTLVNISDATYRTNSGVIPPVDVRFGQIEDTGYTNCLVNSSGSHITSFQHFDYTYGEDLEKLMCRLRLSDVSTNNGRYEGTFRKISDSDNYLTPIDMLTFPVLNFTTLPDNTDQIAIDNFEWDVAKNRYKLRTHTPNQTNLTAFSDVSFNRGYFDSRPEDSADPLLEYAYFRNP